MVGKPPNGFSLTYVACTVLGPVHRGFTTPFALLKMMSNLAQCQLKNLSYTLPRGTHREGSTNAATQPAPPSLHTLDKAQYYHLVAIPLTIDSNIVAEPVSYLPCIDYYPSCFPSPAPNSPAFCSHK